MEQNQKKSTLDIVSDDPIARAVALELSYTRLGPSGEYPPYGARWMKPDVLQATVAVLKRIDQLGYEIVPKPLEDTPPPSEQ